MRNRKRRKTDIHSLPNLGEFRKELRKTLTPAEATFWKIVKSSKFEGRKFVRQHSVGNYILDFYCAPLRLAVEVDGLIHGTGSSPQHDTRRDAWLTSQGVEVIRYSAADVLKNADAVAHSIWTLVLSRTR